MPCGGTHERLTMIPIGAPMLVITLEKVRALYRCESCAGEPAPADIVIKGEQPIAMVRATQAALLKALPFDYKTAQAGDDE